MHELAEIATSHYGYMTEKNSFTHVGVSSSNFCFSGGGTGALHGFGEAIGGCIASGPFFAAKKVISSCSASRFGGSKVSAIAACTQDHATRAAEGGEIGRAHV